MCIRTNQNEHVGGVPHLPAAEHDAQDEGVANDAEDDDAREYDRHQPADD